MGTSQAAAAIPRKNRVSFFHSCIWCLWKSAASAGRHTLERNLGSGAQGGRACIGPAGLLVRFPRGGVLPPIPLRFRAHRDPPKSLVLLLSRWGRADPPFIPFSPFSVCAWAEGNVGLFSCLGLPSLGPADTPESLD